jgi:hypothetical protein
MKISYKHIKNNRFHYSLHCTLTYHVHMVTYRLDFWWQRSRGSWRRLCWFLDAAHLEVLVEVGAVLQALWTKSTCVTVYSSFSDPLQEPEPKLVHKNNSL